MKYYSEILNEVFDTPEKLASAEQAHTDNASKKSKKREKPLEVDTQSQSTAPTKKQLAAAVESADEAVKEAYANYESARSKVEELSKKYLAEVNTILEPAQKAVKEAEQKRYQAIRNFNDSFGAYQVTYTGARAADDMMRALSSINARADKLFRDMFWI